MYIMNITSNNKKAKRCHIYKAETSEALFLMNVVSGCVRDNKIRNLEWVLGKNTLLISSKFRYCYGIAAVVRM